MLDTDTATSTTIVSDTSTSTSERLQEPAWLAAFKSVLGELRISYSNMRANRAISEVTVVNTRYLIRLRGSLVSVAVLPTRHRHGDAAGAGVGAGAVADADTDTDTCDTANELASSIQTALCNRGFQAFAEIVSSHTNKS